MRARQKALRVSLAVTLLSAMVLAVSPAAAQDNTVGETGELLSAFFGLDESARIQRRTRPVCGLNSGRDGMPVVFSHEVDATTLEATDFEITRASGVVSRPACVTLRPANDPGERRTALLIGQFGGPADPPVRVDVVGDVVSIDGSVNMLGAEVDVIALDAGPSMVFAEVIPRSEWETGGPDNCPEVGLESIIRVVWSGGVTAVDGDEIGPEEWAGYQVFSNDDSGGLFAERPFAVGDLNDNDNNHELCMNTQMDWADVAYTLPYLVDPNGDRNSSDETVSISN